MRTGEQPSSNPPPSIPDHTLLRPIGRGAYGEVWLARNVMGALRAVKVIWRRQFESERPFDREFAGIQRFEPVSRSSGGLVHVLHVGRNEAEGYFYYVMELADAVGPRNEQGKTSPPEAAPDSPVTLDSYSPRTLRSDLKQLIRLPTADCVRLALDVVSGLSQLHRHGLVHRDVKPGNIIYVHGRAKLADLGLVSAGGEGRTFVGTEGYIPPEGPGSASADIYALGIVLYEASTGYSPERFPDLPPEWLADDAADEPLEFHEIILKACEGQRERRYQSAEAMQADLALLQSGQSLRRVRALERRYTRLRLAGIVGTFLLACAILAVFFANYRARVAAENRAKETRLREEAQDSLARAEAAEHETEQQLYTALLEQARATVRSGELGQRVKALAAVRRAAAISNSVELRREVLAALSLPDLRFERRWPLATNVIGLQLDPAFERLAVSQGKGAVEIRAAADNRLLASLPASTNLPAYLLSWSADGRFLSVKRDRDTTGRRAILEVWNVEQARRVLLVPNSSFGALAFHPHQPQILAVRSGAVAIWDLESGRELKQFPFSSDTVHSVAFSPDGERFAALQAFPTRNTVTVHSAVSGEVMFSREFAEWVNELAWCADGQGLALADRDGRVQILDLPTGELHLLGRHTSQAVALALHPDGRYLISGGWDRTLICWDLRTRQRAFSIELDSYHLQFSADGRRCSTAVRSRASSSTELFDELKLHAFESAIAHREFREDLGGQLRSAAFSPDSRWLAASATRRCGVWDLAEGETGALDDDAYNTQLCFTRDGRELFGSRTEEGKNDCFRWQLAPATNRAMPPKLTRLPLGKPEGFTSLGVHSNSIVFTGSKGSQMRELAELENGSDYPWARTSQGYNGISPDGRWLAIRRTFGDTLYVHRLPDLKAVTTLKSSLFIGEFLFSPLGDEIVTCSTASRTAIFWRIGTWERIRSITNVMRVRYTPDARALWLAKDWRTAGLHDARTLELFLPLPTGMHPLAVSPDGRYLAVSVDLRRLQVWDLVEVRSHLAELGLDWRE